MPPGGQQHALTEFLQTAATRSAGGVNRWLGEFSGTPPHHGGFSPTHPALPQGETQTVIMGNRQTMMLSVAGKILRVSAWSSRVAFNSAGGGPRGYGSDCEAGILCKEPDLRGVLHGASTGPGHLRRRPMPRITLQCGGWSFGRTSWPR